MPAALACLPLHAQPSPDLAKLESYNAEQLTKIGGHIAVPLKDPSQFLPQDGQAGGLQDVLYAVRDQTRDLAEQHSTLAHDINEGIVHSLQRTKTEIKNVRLALRSLHRLADLVDCRISS